MGTIKEILLTDTHVTIITTKKIYKYGVLAEYGHDCWVVVDSDRVGDSNQCIGEELLEIDATSCEWQLTIKTSGGYYYVDSRAEWGYESEFYLESEVSI
jgi:hypothetical protein